MPEASWPIDRSFWAWDNCFSKRLRSVISAPLRSFDGPGGMRQAFTLNSRVPFHRIDSNP
jgi:hypothetical protein